MISRFIEVILIEHIDTKGSLDSKLQIDYICSIRIRSRNKDIVEKLLQLILNPCEIEKTRQVQNHMAHIGPQLTEHAKTISLLKSDLDRVFRNLGINLTFTLLRVFSHFLFGQNFKTYV